jgi:hypothetical protein
MTWFKVDDGWHKHRKRIRAGLDMEGMAAQGLWAAAGSWASDEHTDGWVPAEVVDYLSPKIGRKLAARLVKAALWSAENRNGEEGWQFHAWVDRNPTSEEEAARSAKKSSGGALGNHRRWHVGRRVDPRCLYCSDTVSVYRSDTRSEDQSENRLEVQSADRNGGRTVTHPPTRPDPSRPEPLSSKSKSSTKTGGVDLGSPLTKNNPPNVDESDLPYAQRHRKRWCDEHGSPDDRHCVACLQEHGDIGYWSKRSLSSRGEK